MKSKTLIITIVIIAIITILWYFKKKTKDVSSEDNENQEEKSSEGISILGTQIGNNTGRKPKPEKDTSFGYQKADISTKEALELVKNAKKSELLWDDEWNEWTPDQDCAAFYVKIDNKIYGISQNTWKALHDAGVYCSEDDYVDF